MLRIRRFKATNTDTIEKALADLPEGSFRQLLALPNTTGYTELYMVVFELTEEQEKTWTPEYASVEKSKRTFTDY